jgi:hypothetical protein
VRSAREIERRLAGGLPRLARIGCDDGWLSLSPFFLNFGTPALLVDQQILSCPQRLGLEPFGLRDPSRPLPASTIQTSIAGGGVALYTRSRSGRILLAAHWFDDHDAQIHRWPPTRKIVLIVGCTRDVELSWSALWTCWIGLSPSPTAGAHTSDLHPACA